MKHIVTVDAGGTKTRAAMINENSEIRTEFIGGCGNLALDIDSAEHNIVLAVSEVMRTSPQKPAAVIVGAAGVSAGGAAQKLKEKLECTFAVPAYITSDGILALYAALGDRDGMTVVSGTGSIVLAKKRNEISRAGGWGHLLGETGSGASIGYSLLTYICQCHDRGCCDNEAESAVFRELGIESIGEMISFVYSHPKSDAARLASVENSLALSGNEGAKARLKKAAEALCECAADHYLRNGFVSEKISLSGGCFGSISVFREYFLEGLAEKLPHAVCRYENIDPACGGVYLYRQFAE